MVACAIPQRKASTPPLGNPLDFIQTISHRGLLWLVIFACFIFFKFPLFKIIIAKVQFSFLFFPFYKGGQDSPERAHWFEAGPMQCRFWNEGLIQATSELSPGQAAGQTSGLGEPHSWSVPLVLQSWKDWMEAGKNTIKCFSCPLAGKILKVSLGQWKSVLLLKAMPSGTKINFHSTTSLLPVGQRNRHQHKLVWAGVGNELENHKINKDLDLSLLSLFSLPPSLLPLSNSSPLMAD